MFNLVAMGTYSLDWNDVILTMVGHERGTSEFITGTQSGAELIGNHGWRNRELVTINFTRSSETLSTDVIKLPIVLATLSLFSAHDKK